MSRGSTFPYFYFYQLLTRLLIQHFNNNNITQKAASIAAIFCNSRDIISKSGILPALSYLIESIGSHHRGGGGGGSVHAFTPFHPEFMQICLLAGQYRYAQSFLQSHPVYNMTLDSSSSSSSSRNGIRLHPTMYLRYHYYAGLVHIGCDDWNSSLDSFYLCITIPCQAVSAISIAARKKSLLVECILLEAEEMDNNSGSGGRRWGGVQWRIECSMFLVRLVKLFRAS